MGDAESTLEPAFLTKLGWREDRVGAALTGALGACVGVVAPDGYADKPALAGVDGGGLAPVRDSDVAENGRARSTAG